MKRREQGGANRWPRAKAGRKNQKGGGRVSERTGKKHVAGSVGRRDVAGEGQSEAKQLVYQWSKDSNLLWLPALNLLQVATVVVEVMLAAAAAATTTNLQ